MTIKQWNDSGNVKVYSLTRNSRLISFLLLITFICLLGLYSFNSSGIIRSPGDDEDSGSGFGGTGRQLLPGSGSGLGGTGMRPFLGYDASHDKAIEEVQVFLFPEAGINPVIADVSLPADSAAPALEFPIPRSINIAITTTGDPLSEGAGSINITEAIQRDVDISARTINSSIIASFADRSSPASTIEDVVESKGSDSSAEAEDLTWARLANALEQDSAHDTNTDSNADNVTAEQNQDRVNRPQGIQRPVLPPLQRVRPVQRAGLLPPPIRPLRI